MKFGKKFLSLALALVMVFSLTTGASAATREQVTAYLNYNITVTYNGKAQVLSNVNGTQVYPVTYGGTTYVPIRAIGYLLGLKVDWEQSTKTVLLDEPAKGETVSTPDAKADNPARTGMEEIKPYIEPGITVKFNGKAQEMKTVKGERVYPMLYNGTTYLPIRAVSNMLGLDVDWEQSTQTVILTASDPTSPVATIIINGNTIKIYSESEADIRAALATAGLTEDDINAAIKDLETVKTSPKPNIDENWAEIDLSTADKGYVRVKANEQPGDWILCDIQWHEDGKAKSLIL